MCGERESAGRRPARFGERFGERHKARLTHPGRNVENERRKPPGYGIIADAFLRREVSDTRFQHFAPQGPARWPRTAMRELRRSQHHRALREKPPLRGFGGGEPSSPGPPLKRKHTPCACLRVRRKNKFFPSFGLRRNSPLFSAHDLDASTRADRVRSGRTRARRACALVRPELPRPALALGHGVELPQACV